MPEPAAELTIEQKLRNLKRTISKYKRGRPTPTPEVVVDVTKAIHELSDHLITLNRRIEKLERNQKEWTTRGWVGRESSAT